MGDSPVAVLNFEPGIQRDGTRFDAKRYVDSLWCRWRLGKPRKIGGYVEIYDKLRSVPRKIHQFFQGQNTIVHVGTAAGIQQIVLDQNGNVVSFADRTPTTFSAGPLIGWTFDAIFDTTSQVVQLVAHAVNDLSFLASNTGQIPWIGQIDSTTPLAQMTQPGNIGGGNYTAPKVAGGVFCSQPYVWAFDTAGRVFWSAPNLPFDLGVAQGTSGAGTARISAQKIVAGMALRGGGSQSPAALFWSLSEVISAAFIGGTAVWAFNTISPSSSILGSDAVVEYDGLYFWPGIDRFMVYNGTVTELPNTQNQDYFFDNMNWQYAAKTFAFKVPRYGEIWFCAPLFGNTEPSHAIIYNVRENTWYDTVLPEGGRSCAFFAQGLRYPIMGGSVPDPNTGGYRLFLHENGFDASFDEGPQPVRSFFETGFFGGPKNDPADNRALVLGMLEPDFIQAGDLFGYLITSANPKAKETNGPQVPIRLVPQVPQDQAPSFTQSSRLARLHVESNTLGGNYIAGRCLLHMDPNAADARVLQ